MNIGDGALILKCAWLT